MRKSTTWKRGRLLLPFFLFFLFMNPVFAQEGEPVAGKVIGAADGRPLIGITVKVKGSAKGTSTDEHGAFSIRAKAGDVLELSGIGYLSQEVNAEPGKVLTIALKEAPNGLDEVVVVGYGTQKKKVVTGATVRVGGDDLDKNHTISVGEALQGQAAGVQVTANSGQPGDALKIRIRGVGTNGDPSPLFVVDGMPTTDISYLNTNDIESIDILKDAASASIYGTEAANGVVLITTKKGRAGFRRLTFDTYYGWQNPIRRLDVLNAKEYVMIMNESGINSGKAPYDPSIYPFNSFTTAQLDSIGNGTNWQKAATMNNAVTESYSLGMSGGNDQTVYSSSLNYQRQQGMIGLPGKSYLERINFRINSEHKVYKDIFKVGEDLTYTHSNQSGILTGNIYGNSLRALLNTSPLFPVRAPDGSYAYSKEPEESNPIAAMDYQNNNKTITDRIFGDLYGEVNILKGLTLRSNIGIDLDYYSTNTFTPHDSLSIDAFTTTTTAGMGLYRTFIWDWNNTATYKRTFGSHNFTLLAGTDAKNTSVFYVNGTKQGLAVADLNNAVINAATNPLTQLIYGDRSEIALASLFGRLIYSYQDKYLFTGSVRRDGSTSFGENKRYGVFPAFSAGWVVTSEDFFKPVSWLNFLKLRGGWGQNGNDRIRQFAYVNVVSNQYQGYYFGGEDATSLSVGASPTQIANPNLQWEASEQTDVGFDATVFRDFTVNFDLYNKTTKEWLVVAPIPASVGTGAPYINGGDIQNKGLELSVNYRHTFGQVTLGLGGNLSFIKNTVLQVPTADGIIHGATNLLSSNTEEFYRVQSGHPLAYFWGYKVAGIFQSQEDVNKYTGKQGLIQPGALPGDVKFADLNGDGVIDQNDKTQIGSPQPKQTFGINFSLGYKGFDLIVLMSGVGGNQIVDGVRSNDRYYNNYTTDILKRWHGAGTSNSQPRVTLGDEANKNWNRFSSLYIQNGAFLRIKSVNLGYDLKRVLLRATPVKSMRLYVSGLNLYTFTHYRGIDPEVGYGNTETDGTNWSSGIDLGYYPQPRSIIVGLSVGL